MLCPSCGASVGEELRLCEDCESRRQADLPDEVEVESEAGNDEEHDVEELSVESSLEESTAETSAVLFSDHAGHAGFWLRTAAFLIDAALVSLIEKLVSVLVLQTLFGSGLEAMLSGAISAPSSSTASTLFLMSIVSVIVAGLVIGLTFGWLYYALFESSSFRATPGKILVGLEVLREDGAQLGFGRASARYFGKILSYAILGLGFVLAAFTSQKQALHDSLAACLVVRKEPIPIWKGFACGIAGLIALLLVDALGGMLIDSPSLKRSSTSVQQSRPAQSNNSSTSSMFIPVTQGELVFGEQRVPIQSSYSLYDPLSGTLEIAFFASSLGGAERKILRELSTFTGASPLKPDFLYRASVKRDSAVCSPESLIARDVTISKKPQGARLSAQFDLTTHLDSEADIRCQLADGKPLKASLRGRGEKETRDGVVPIEWNLETQSRVVVPDTIAPIEYRTEDAKDQIALWNPLENSLLIAFYSEKLSEKDRLTIRQAKSVDAVAQNQPPVVLAFDLRESPEEFKAESLIKYGISFLRDTTPKIRFPGKDDEVSFYYVPTVQATEKLANVQGFLREGEQVSGSLTYSAVKQLASLPISFSWVLDFSATVIDTEVLNPTTATTASSVDATSSARAKPFAQATAGSVTLEFKSSLALYYPEEKDVAIGFYSEELTDAERQMVKDNRFLWTYVNNKRPNLVIFLNLRRSATHAESKSLLDYTAYFYRDKIGSFYFPGVHDRRSFKRLAIDINSEELRGLEGFASRWWRDRARPQGPARL